MSYKGDCLEVACKNVLKNDGLLFCYAYVMGQGNLKGQRILHAWNERGEIILDNSNQRNIIMRKELYYKIAQIKEEDVTKQTIEEVRNLLLETKIYGGWIK